MNHTWHPLIAETEFPEIGKLKTVLNSWHVLIGKTDDGYSAINDRCTHQAASLEGGRIRRGAIMCPLHGARFDLASGRCLGGGYKDIRAFDLRIRDGVIEVLLPNDPPSPEEIPQQAT